MKAIVSAVHQRLGWKGILASLFVVQFYLFSFFNIEKAEAQTHDVFFSKMVVNDCKEIGTCDWRLKCTVSDQQSQEFFTMKEADTGGSIAIGQSITSTRDFPLTVVCDVHEHDGEIGAEWESVGSPSIKVFGIGEYTLTTANDEGDVDIHFTIDDVGTSSQGLTASVAKRYAGLFRSGGDGHVLWTGVEWPNFEARWKELSKEGLRLVDFETYVEGNRRLYSGVFRAGNDKHFLWSGVEWAPFVEKWKELSNNGLRLIDLETYEEGGKRLYAGVFRGAQMGISCGVGLSGRPLWKSGRS